MRINSPASFVILLALGAITSDALPVQETESQAEVEVHPAYQPNSPYLETTEAIHVLRDESRGRDIELRITAPVRPPKSATDERESQRPQYPVVIFSHGLGGSNRAFPEAAKLWASAGYIVIRPTHADSGSLRGLRQAREGRGPLRDPLAWESRALDQIAILEALSELDARVAVLLDVDIDAERIASAGHSFGSQTCQMLAGARLQTGDGATIELKDPRIDAAIPISVQVPGQMGFTDNAYAGMDMPVLLITGTKDGGQSGTTGLDRTRVFDLYPPGDKHMLFINDAAHSSFQDRSEMRAGARLITRTGNPPEVDAACALHTRTVALAFLDAYLKDCDHAMSYLKSQRPAQVESSTAVFLSR